MSNEDIADATETMSNISVAAAAAAGFSWLKVDDVVGGLAADFDGSLSGLGDEPSSSSAYNMSEALLALPVFKQEATTTAASAVTASQIFDDEAFLSLPLYKHDELSTGIPLLTAHRFQCVLCATTSPVTLNEEETLTYLNQGQPYEIRLKKSQESDEYAGQMMKSHVRVLFHDRRLQYSEQAQLDSWKQMRPGEQIIDLDLPLSHNIIDPIVSASSINSLEFCWVVGTEARPFIKVNCISTEFTAKKHGGEKGVSFRVQVETYRVGAQPPRSPQLSSRVVPADEMLVHCCSCQIKVFKPKGADRKHKTDCIKMEKKSESDKTRYRPPTAFTILTETPVELARSSVQTRLNSVNDKISSEKCRLSGDGGSSRSFVSLADFSNTSAHSVTSSSPPSSYSGMESIFDLSAVTLSPTQSQKVEIQEVETPGSEKAFPVNQPSTLTASTTALQVSQWLHANRFSKHIQLFQNFSGSDLLRLTRDDLIQICGIVDGIRLNNALQSKSIQPLLTIYVCQDYGEKEETSSICSHSSINAPAVSLHQSTNSPTSLPSSSLPSTSLTSHIGDLEKSFPDTASKTTTVNENIKQMSSAKLVQQTENRSEDKSKKSVVLTVDVKGRGTGDTALNEFLHSISKHNVTKIQPALQSNTAGQLISETTSHHKSSNTSCHFIEDGSGQTSDFNKTAEVKESMPNHQSEKQHAVIKGKEVEIERFTEAPINSLTSTTPPDQAVSRTRSYSSINTDQLSEILNLSKSVACSLAVSAGPSDEAPTTSLVSVPASDPILSSSAPARPMLASSAPTDPLPPASVIRSTFPTDRFISPDGVPIKVALTSAVKTIGDHHHHQTKQGENPASVSVSLSTSISDIIRPADHAAPPAHSVTRVTAVKSLPPESTLPPAPSGVHQKSLSDKETQILSLSDKVITSNPQSVVSASNSCPKSNLTVDAQRPRRASTGLISTQVTAPLASVKRQFTLLDDDERPPDEIVSSKKQRMRNLELSRTAVYHAVYLPMLTVTELRSQLSALYSVNPETVIDIYLHGPSHILILVTDKVVENLANESRYAIEAIQDDQAMNRYRIFMRKL